MVFKVTVDGNEPLEILADDAPGALDLLISTQRLEGSRVVIQDADNPDHWVALNVWSRGPQ